MSGRKLRSLSYKKVMVAESRIFIYFAAGLQKNYGKETLNRFLLPSFL